MIHISWYSEIFTGYIFFIGKQGCWYWQQFDRSVWGGILFSIPCCWEGMPHFEAEAYSSPLLNSCFSLFLISWTFLGKRLRSQQRALNQINSMYGKVKQTLAPIPSEKRLILLSLSPGEPVSLYILRLFHSFFSCFLGGFYLLALQGCTLFMFCLQHDDKGFAHPERIEKLVKNYSQFVSFPIYTWQEKGYTKEVSLHWLLLVLIDPPMFASLFLRS